jgi:hypothetical protein
MGVWDNNDWSQRLFWTDDLAAMVDGSYDLIALLNQVRPCRVINDRRIWLASTTSKFSVNSAYLGLLNRSVTDSLDATMVISLKKLWKNNVPSKISIFSWRLLLEKLPTREALFCKGIITNSLERGCVLCSNMEESVAHVFLHCHVTVAIWQHILGWMDTGFFMTGNVQDHFIQFGDIIKVKANKRFRHVFWLATTWSLWRACNNILFRGETVNISLLVDQIKFMSWFWFTGRACKNV